MDYTCGIFRIRKFILINKEGLNRMIKMAQAMPLEQYKDHKQIPDWALPAVRYVVSSGLMVGYGGLWNPTPQRLELACVLYKLSKRDGQFRDILPKILPPVVKLFSDDFGQIGSGTIITPHGLVLTNHHVVRNDDYNYDKVLISEFGDAELITACGWSDLALLQLPKRNELYPYMPISRIRPEKGEAVLVIGSPLGLDEDLSLGIVGETIDTPDGPAFHTDAAINPGNSGGACVNEAGYLIGVPTFKFNDYDNMGFCLHVDEIHKFLEGVGISGVDGEEE
jgi:S1-C subfamily serine protease